MIFMDTYNEYPRPPNIKRKSIFFWGGGELTLILMPSLNDFTQKMLFSKLCVMLLKDATLPDIFLCEKNQFNQGAAWNHGFPEPYPSGFLKVLCVQEVVTNLCSNLLYKMGHYFLDI